MSRRFRYVTVLMIAPMTVPRTLRGLPPGGGGGAVENKSLDARTMGGSLNTTFLPETAFKSMSVNGRLLVSMAFIVTFSFAMGHSVEQCLTESIGTFRDKRGD